MTKWTKSTHPKLLEATLVETMTLSRFHARMILPLTLNCDV